MNFEKNLVYFTGYPADHDNNKNEIMDQDDDDKYDLKEIISAKLKGSIKFLFYLCTYLFSCVKKMFLLARLVISSIYRAIFRTHSNI